MSLHVESSYDTQRIELWRQIVGWSGSLLIAVLLVGFLLMAMDRFLLEPVEEYRPTFVSFSDPTIGGCGGLPGCGGRRFAPKKPTAPYSSQRGIVHLGEDAATLLNIPNYEADFSEVELGERQGFEVGYSMGVDGSSTDEVW